MRQLALLWIVVAACGGGEAPRALGKPADPAALLADLEELAVLDPPIIGRTLALRVLSHCGADCTCLVSVSTDGGPPCPSANPTVPERWPPMELAGRYLAAQIARAKAADRTRLLAALDAVRVPVPRIDPARWKLAPAGRQRALSPTLTLIGLAADGTRSTDAMPMARFDATGAHIEQAATAPILLAPVPPPPPPPPPPSDPYASLDVSGDLVDEWPDLEGDSGLIGPSVVGQVDGAIRYDTPAIAADRGAPASRVLDALTEHGGVLAVEGGATVRELPIAFTAESTTDPTAWDLRVTAELVTLGIRDGGFEQWPVSGGHYDTDAVKAALAAATTAKAPLVGVAIEAGTAAELIAAIDLAIGAGAGRVRVIANEGFGFGRIGHGSGAGTGGAPFPTATGPQVSLGQPSAMGDLDKAIIRRYIKRHIGPITRCYEQGLLAHAGLAGTLSTQFFITPRGEVASVNATGLDPDVARCVAAIIKDIEFPHPGGGGGVQVNYPFNFRAAP